MSSICEEFDFVWFWNYSYEGGPQCHFGGKASRGRLGLGLTSMPKPTVGTSLAMATPGSANLQGFHYVCRGSNTSQLSSPYFGGMLVELQANYA